MTLDRARRRRRARPDDRRQRAVRPAGRGAASRRGSADQSLFQAMRDAARRPSAPAASSSRTWSAAPSPIASCSPAPASSASRFEELERARRSGRAAAAQFQRRRHVADRPALWRAGRGDDQLHGRSGQRHGRHPHGDRAHHRFVARLHRQGRARGHRRGRSKKAGAKFVWLEDVREPASRSWTSWPRCCCGAGRWPRQDADRPAVILFTSGLGRHAEGGGARQPQPRRQCPAGAGAPRAVARRQAAQRAAGLPFLRADRRDHPAAAGRRPVLPLPLAAPLQGDPRDGVEDQADHHVCDRHVPHGLCAHRRRQRFREPEAGGGRRRGGARRDAARLARAVRRRDRRRLRHDRGVAGGRRQFARRMAATARSDACCPECACRSSRSKASPMAASCGSPART